MKLNAQEKAYFAQLVAQIVTTHGEKALEAFQTDPMAVVAAAHDKRQEFALEMLHGRTERAKMAHEVIVGEVYSEAVKRSSRQKSLERCEYIADRSFRKSIGFA